MKKWQVLTESSSIDEIIKTFLAHRGITNILEFLNPPSTDSLLTTLNNEFTHSLSEAVKLIQTVIYQNTPIIIHGDYDADGICATAILYKTLKNELAYGNVYHFIPNRFEHGYGLSKQSIESIVKTHKLGGKKALFITVDSGITAIEEVKLLKSLGYEVIITDHHQKPNPLPEAGCIVWNDELVGSTISWILSKSLGSKDPQSISLAALATVTDLFPLVGFNRSLVKEGLEVLNSNPPLGIKMLLDYSAKSLSEITTYDLGWIIGPRLNASGRLVDASDSLKLLIEDDPEVVDKIAKNLNDVNTQRQDKTVEMYEIASINSAEKLPKIIISSHEDYHEGIIGLVAARLTQKYYRPSIVISLSENFGKGSVRSIPGVDIIALLRRFENLFTSLGGHPMAAGFTIVKENLPVLQEKLLIAAEDLIQESMLVPVLEIDMKIPLDLVNISLAQELNKLKPFGIGNSEPIFMSENVGVANVNFVGKEQNHMSLRLFSGTNFYKAIYFNGKELSQEMGIKIGDKVDVAYAIRESEYNGSKYVDLVVKDLRKPEQV